jgi:hypothetical protein
MSSSQLGLRAGLSSKSGTFATYLGRARQAGWIEGRGDRLSITPAGLEALGEYEPLPTGPELLAYWVRELGGGAARMLEVLAARYPHSASSEEVAEAAGLSGNSGTFGTYLGRLRKLELVGGGWDALRASEELFD